MDSQVVKKGLTTSKPPPFMHVCNAACVCVCVCVCDVNMGRSGWSLLLPPIISSGTFAVEHIKYMSHVSFLYFFLIPFSFSRGFFFLFLCSLFSCAHSPHVNVGASAHQRGSSTATSPPPAASSLSSKPASCYYTKT